MMHETPNWVPDDRNDGGDEVAEGGWSREFSASMRMVSGATPVAQLFMRARALSMAINEVGESTDALWRADAAMLDADAGFWSCLTFLWGVRLLRWATQSMAREREAMRRDIRVRMGWKADGGGRI